MPYGSLMNVLADSSTNARADTPAVGDGATVLSWTDRKSATVVAVKSPTRVVVNFDDVTYGGPGAKPVVNAFGTGMTVTVTKRKDGRWKVAGPDNRTVMFGVRDPYYDYDF